MVFTTTVKGLLLDFGIWRYTYPSLTFSSLTQQEPDVSIEGGEQEEEGPLTGLLSLAALWGRLFIVIT